MRNVFYHKDKNIITLLFKSNKRLDIPTEQFNEIGNLWLEENMRSQISFYAFQHKIKLSSKQLSSASKALSLFVTCQPPEEQIKSALKTKI